MHSFQNIYDNSLAKIPAWGKKGYQNKLQLLLNHFVGNNLEKPVFADTVFLWGYLVEQEAWNTRDHASMNDLSTPPPPSPAQAVCIEDLYFKDTVGHVIWKQRATILYTHLGFYVRNTLQKGHIPQFVTNENF